MTANLTGKQAKFVEEYLQDFNATRAAQRAGYSGNLNTLAAIGSENLRKPNIAQAIKVRLQESAMSADEVLQRLAEQARGVSDSYIGESGELDIVQLKRDGKAHLIKRVRDTRHGRDYEFYDAQRALDLIGKHFALFVDRTTNLNVDLSQLTNEQLNRIAAGEDPIAVLATPGEGGAREAEAWGLGDGGEDSA